MSLFISYLHSDQKSAESLRRRSSGHSADSDSAVSCQQKNTKKKQHVFYLRMWILIFAEETELRYQVLLVLSP